MSRNPEQLVDVTAMPRVVHRDVRAHVRRGRLRQHCPLPADPHPGIIAMTTITACVAAGIQLRDDMDKGVFDRFRSLPIARIAPLAGPMMADLARYAIAAGITLTVA